LFLVDYLQCDKKNFNTEMQKYKISYYHPDKIFLFPLSFIVSPGYKFINFVQNL